MSKPIKFLLLLLAVVLVIFAGIQCAKGAEEQLVLRLATTTSVENSGLLAEIIPVFEDEYQIEVDVIAVGTGQALAIGRSGDVDVLIVHAPALEEEFVSEGYGTQRIPIMYNDFIIAGPMDDPAGISNKNTAVEALQMIANTESNFVSRGDNSGTHFLEQNLWIESGITPDPDSDWYHSIGQGMGATLTFANETLGYLITDRGTFLAQSPNLPDLVVLFGGVNVTENPDSTLYNYYSMIPLNPDTHPQTQSELVDQFATWFTSVETQSLIENFGIETFNQSLFFPNSEVWHNSKK